MGFIWLGAAVVIWPVVTRLLDWGKQFVIKSHWLEAKYRCNFMTLTTFIQQLIGTILLFFAVLYLSRMNGTELPKLKTGLPLRDARDRPYLRCRGVAFLGSRLL